MVGGQESADDGDGLGSQMESEGARKRGKRGGKKRSQRAARQAAATGGVGAAGVQAMSDLVLQSPTRSDAHDEDQWDGLKGFSGRGACEKTVGACLRGERPHGSDLVVTAPGAGSLISCRQPAILAPGVHRVTEDELVGGVQSLVDQALGLHPSLRAAAVPRVVLSQGLHEHSGLLDVKEPLILAAAKVTFLSVFSSLSLYVRLLHVWVLEACC